MVFVQLVKCCDSRGENRFTLERGTDCVRQSESVCLLCGDFFCFLLPVSFHAFT